MKSCSARCAAALPSPSDTPSRSAAWAWVKPGDCATPLALRGTAPFAAAAPSLLLLAAAWFWAAMNWASTPRRWLRYSSDATLSACSWASMAEIWATKLAPLLMACGGVFICWTPFQLFSFF